MLVEEMVFVVLHEAAALQHVTKAVVVAAGTQECRNGLAMRPDRRGEARQHEVGARRTAHRGVEGPYQLPDLVDGKDADVECVEAGDATLEAGATEVGPGIIGDGIAMHVILVAVQVGAAFEERGAGGGDEMCGGVWCGSFELKGSKGMGFHWIHFYVHLV